MDPIQSSYVPPPVLEAIQYILLVELGVPAGSLGSAVANFAAPLDSKALILKYNNWVGINSNVKLSEFNETWHQYIYQAYMDVFTGKGLPTGFYDSLTPKTNEDIAVKIKTLSKKFQQFGMAAATGNDGYKLPANSDLFNQVSHTDPLKNYEALMNNTAPTSKEPIDEVPSNHSTLVVINISSGSSDKLRERAKRFVSSLNTESTMKADIVTVVDGKMYAGLVILPGVPGGFVPSMIGQTQLIIVNP